MAVDSREFSEPVEVRKITTVNTDGNAVASFETVAMVYGKWTPLQGRMLERAKSYGDSINTTVRVRYRPDIDFAPEKYALWLPNRCKLLGGLIAINDNGANETYTIYCTETR